MLYIRQLYHGPSWKHVASLEAVVLLNCNLHYDISPPTRVLARNLSKWCHSIIGRYKTPSLHTARIVNLYGQSLGSDSNGALA